MATRDDLIKAVLQDLGVLQAGESAVADDNALVSARIDPLLADLAVRNVIYIPDAVDISDGAFQYIVDILVELCSPAFGRPREAANIAQAEARLRTIQRIGKGVPGARLKVDCALVWSPWRSRGRI